MTARLLHEQTTKVSEKLYHRLIDNQSTALLLLNADLRIEYLNNAAQDVLAVSGARMRGQNFESVFNEGSDCVSEFEQAIHSGHPYTKRESRIELSEGRTLIADYTVTPIAGSQPFLLLEIFPRDRWLRISREEHLIWQHEASRALIRGMAHEIKNPLGGIRGAAQLLSLELEEKSLKDYTEIIIQEADRLRALLDQMLGPNKKAEKSALNIHEVLERVASLISSEAAGNVKVCKDYDPSIPNIVGNAEHLIQATLNIARNALQALNTLPDEQTKKITFITRTIRQVTLGSKRHRIVCRIDIRDNGPGIPHELQDSIFYPMITNRAEGTGLGLTIAQQIINQHGGLIEYASEPGETCFTLFIPILEGDH